MCQAHVLTNQVVMCLYHNVTNLYISQITNACTRAEILFKYVNIFS